jgi:hypothetical protein
MKDWAKVRVRLHCKNAAARGVRIQFDAFKIAGAATPIAFPEDLRASG